MRSPVELESEALAEDVKAQQLEAEAFTLSKAGNPTWVINEQQAKSHRDFAFILRQRALLARQQHSSQPLIQWEPGYVADGPFIKRARQTMTIVETTRQDLLSSSHRDDHYFDTFPGGWNEKVLEEFLSSSLGKKIKEEWRRAESEQAIQECLDIMIPELLQKLHGQEHETSRPTYYNKCGKGFLCGRSMAIGCSICEGSRCMDAHVGTFMEATHNLQAQQMEVVGQSWDRVQALCEKQPRRNTWRTAIIGKDAFQLWEFKTNMTEWGFQIKSSALTHFSLEVDSPGFQRFVRWLATDLKALGFISPPRPDVLAPSNVVIDGVIVGDDASHADEPAKKRQRVHVYKVQMEDKEAAVAKIPDSHFRYDIEGFNMRLVKEQQGLRGRTTVLAGKARIQLGQRVRDALIIKPYAQHIPLDTSFQQLVLYMRQYVETVRCLYDAGYLHRDLSYSNLLITEDRAIISDWESMARIEEEEEEAKEAGARGLRTGTPLFAAFSTLDGGPHTLSSELEALFNVMLYILSGGVLHWQDMAQEDPHLLDVRRGAMSDILFERDVLKRVEKECWPALQRFRAVFFPEGGYRTDVSCQDFLNAL